MKKKSTTPKPRKTDETRIGKFVVPVVAADYYTVVRFMGGQHGPQEGGDYAFWTAVYKKKAGKDTLVIARARLRFDPGERFRRIGKERRSAPSPEARKDYAKQWAQMGAGKNIKHVRPSSTYEVLKWCCAHVSDAEHIITTLAGGA